MCTWRLNQSRCFLDIQEVWSALKQDDNIWASQIASTGDIKDLELSMHQMNFQQTQVKGHQNLTTNSFIYSCHYFNGHYQLLKGMKVLLDGHLSGIFSTIFDINHHILMVTGSPHPCGMPANKKEVLAAWSPDSDSDTTGPHQRYLIALASCHMGDLIVPGSHSYYCFPVIYSLNGLGPEGEWTSAGCSVAIWLLVYNAGLMGGPGSKWEASH
ncbi:hypothetical protein BS47DRAFT_1362767 [Hydnum rufescens UP504]|uniref:Uncharacterized protein n=1 Tax=Hydnum rufescens UP504 TaxID=1448309 RepID=A0A9P6DWP5_9AGAM|nr:hypothetical protein BS47DRAFT_1362767 [Hydnum rufescens UP504]